MGFLVSPGVDVNELDLTNVIPAVSTSIGGYVGDFTWGPVNQPTLISSETELVEVFGPPTTNNQKSYLEAASFLKYGNALRVVRAVKSSESNNLVNARNAAQLRAAQTNDGVNKRNEILFGFNDDEAGADIGAYIENDDAFDALSLPTVVTRSEIGGNGGDGDSQGTNEPIDAVAGFDWAARFPGSLGNNIAITYEVATSPQEAAAPLNGLFPKPTSTQWAIDTLGASPAVNDEINIVIFDQGGGISGTANTILESYRGLSLLKDAKKDDGSTNYFLEVINRDSNWIYISNAEFFVNSFDRTQDSEDRYNNFQPGMASTATNVVDKFFLIDSELSTLADKKMTIDSGVTEDDFPASQDLDHGVASTFTSQPWWNNDDGGTSHAAAIYSNQGEMLLRNSAGTWKSFKATNINDGLSANDVIIINDFADDVTQLDNDAYYVEWVNINIPEGTASDSNLALATGTGGELSSNGVTGIPFTNIQPYLIPEELGSEGGEDSDETLTFDSFQTGISNITIYPTMPGNFTLETWFNAPTSAVASIPQNNKDGVYLIMDGSVKHDGGYLKNINPTNYSTTSRLQIGGSEFLGGNLLNFGSETLKSTYGFGVTLRVAKFHRINLSQYAITAPSVANNTVEILRLEGGKDASPDVASVVTGLDKFEDAETIDVSLLFSRQMVDGDTTVPKAINTICNTRKDCVGFISPPVTSNSTRDVEEFYDETLNLNSNYLVFDSSPVYVYNKYSDKYEYIQAAGHMAGLCARTDDTNDPWFSPAGYNRGQLLDVAKLKINPNQAQRDSLYKKRINPIVSFPGQGILLFGDKTAQSKPSAFDRINVRRLFIVLEKAIATASKYQLFELNDEFTRAMFRNMVEPFLRDVKGRRGITDFLVVCDETNNTGQVIDSNRFVADIYIKPARSINFITLNFIATRTGVEFTEIAGGQG